jgi:hypothetical protein
LIVSRVFSPAEALCRIAADAAVNEAVIGGNAAFRDGSLGVAIAKCMGFA